MIADQGVIAGHDVIADGPGDFRHDDFFLGKFDVFIRQTANLPIWNRRILRTSLDSVSLDGSSDPS